MSAGASDIRADCEKTAFRTLDMDLGDGLGTGKRICIATPDILGPVKNGGIGTAYHHMARLLTEHGHEVVIAYVSERAANPGLMERTCDFYAEFGVTLEPIVPRPDSNYILSRVRAPTWALHDWLRARERPFDLVHVPDWRGLAYGTLLA